MTQLHKRIPVLSLSIAIAFSTVFSACSKKDDPAPENPNLILQENFDKPAEAVWQPGTNGGAVTAVENGWCTISYTSEGMGTYSIWAPDNIFPADQTTGSVEILLRHTAGHAYDKAGLLFCVTDNQNYVVFSIGDKEFRIYQMVGGQAANLIGWTSSAAIHGNLNEDNKLKVALTGTHLQFFINDQKVIEMGRGAATSLNKIGFQMYKATTATNNTTYKVDYLTVSRQ